MEYERETQEVILRFLARRLTFPETIAALDAALAGVMPTLSAEQLPRLRIRVRQNTNRSRRQTTKP